MYTKDFYNWNIDQKDNISHVRDGEVRWIIFGVNVGSEIDGKGISFTRPGLIISMVGSNLALVIPMSTKIKNDVPGYFQIEWKGKIVSLCIHQIRIFSQKRILHRIGKISENKMLLCKQEVRNFFKI